MIVYFSHIKNQGSNQSGNDTGPWAYTETVEGTVCLFTIGGREEVQAAEVTEERERKGVYQQEEDKMATQTRRQQQQ